MAAPNTRADVPARHIARLVDDLRSSEETRQLLPDDFDAIWEPIRAAAAEVKSHG